MNNDPHDKPDVTMTVAPDDTMSVKALEPQMAELRMQAQSKRKAAQLALDGVRPFDPVEKKKPGWALELENEAKRLEVAVALQEAEWLETLQGALSIDPDLPEAHAALADHHRDELLAAERAHREADIVRAEARLPTHDRRRYAALLRGEVRLTLVTDPPGAEVILERYIEEERRLVPKVVGTLGRTADVFTSASQVPGEARGFSSFSVTAFP